MSRTAKRKGAVGERRALHSNSASDRCSEEGMHTGGFSLPKSQASTLYTTEPGNPSFDTRTMKLAIVPMGSALRALVLSQEVYT